MGQKGIFVQTVSTLSSTRLRSKCWHTRYRSEAVLLLASLSNEIKLNWSVRPRLRAFLVNWKIDKFILSSHVRSVDGYEWNTAFEFQKEVVLRSKILSISLVSLQTRKLDASVCCRDVVAGQLRRRRWTVGTRRNAASCSAGGRQRVRYGSACRRFHHRRRYFIPAQVV